MINLIFEIWVGGLGSKPSELEGLLKLFFHSTGDMTRRSSSDRKRSQLSLINKVF